MIGFEPKPEIITPGPSMVPFPEPDNVTTSPAPRIMPTPSENPTPQISPEIIPAPPDEF